MSSTYRHWSVQDGAHLKALREAAGWELSALAQRHSLSVQQVRQLEEGGSDRFYSPAIKLQAGRKLLQFLGSDLQALPASVEPEPLLVFAEPVVKAPFPMTVLPSTGAQRGHQMPAWGGLILGSALLAGLAWGAYQAWQATAAETPRIAQPQLVATPAPEPVGSVSHAATGPSLLPEPQDTMAPAPRTPTDCEFGASPLPLRVSTPQKPGDYVYFEAQKDVKICIKDAAQQMTVLELGAGRSRSVRGIAPFELMSQQFADVKVFYQGQRLAPALFVQPHVVLRPQAWSAVSSTNP